ncbi:MAG: BMP family ABC transporter substrate-binding protein [Chloroflexi bacterium]|nr:BMP family ABC transporter substrate-binding protein [Chloroflexota bacterium]
MKKQIWSIISILLIVSLLLIGCAKKPSVVEPVEVEEPEEAAQEPFKVGFIYVGAPVDLGWSFEHDQGRLALEEKFGDAIHTAYVENVEEGADTERVLRDFAQKGYDMIFATSFGFMDPMYEVAEDYPEIIFEHCSGYLTRDNMGTYFGRIYQPRYLSGIVAGAMTKTNKIGYVAAYPIPEVIRGIDAFTLGVRSINPDATVSVVWTNTWFDPVVEREAAVALLDQGADVIAQHQDTTEPQKAAAEAGAMSIGYHSDARKFVGDSVLTSAIWNFGGYYIDTVTKAMNGTWKPVEYWGPVADGIVGLAEYSPLVPEEVIAMVDAAKALLDLGEDVFCGPIYDQSGELRVVEGECLTDGEMLSLDWFVEGVIGEIN